MSFEMVNLREIEAEIWRELHACTRDKTHAWRTPVLATTDAVGDAQARVVVLREVDREARRLRFFTDSRSPKVAQMSTRPRGLLIMWSPALRWQLRATVVLEIRVSGSDVSSAWERLKKSGATNDYLARLPPGEAIASAADAAIAQEKTSSDVCGNLALVDASVQSIDWLELGEDAARRARFERDEACFWIQA